MLYLGMKSEDIFATALGLLPPWEVTSVEFQETEESKELHISIDFKKGSKWVNDAEAQVTTYDTGDKTWRHLNFFEHKCHLHCRVPRIPMGDGNYRMIDGKRPSTVGLKVCGWVRRLSLPIIFFILFTYISFYYFFQLKKERFDVCPI